MSDFKVSNFEWTRLQRSANCFVPAMIEIMANFGGELTNKRIAEEAARLNAKNSPEHMVGKVVNLIPVKHVTAEGVIAAYTKIQSERPDYPPLARENIVVAVLAMPDLRTLMESAQLDIDALHEKAGVSVSAINHALNGGRVSAGIVCALYTALEGMAELPPLARFAVSNHRLGNTSISLQAGLSPLAYDDLMLEITLDIPNPWP